jgi:formate hydrogenlyase subunit 3/multisubunit Na+/H+ antiporter MnhD subunit
MPFAGDRATGRPATDRLFMALPITALAALGVVIGLLPGPTVDLARRAARDVLDPAAFTRAVLSPGMAGELNAVPLSEPAPAIPEGGAP